MKRLAFLLWALVSLAFALAGVMWYGYMLARYLLLRWNGEPVVDFGVAGLLALQLVAVGVFLFAGWAAMSRIGGVPPSGRLQPRRAWATMVVLVALLMVEAAIDQLSRP